MCASTSRALASLETVVHLGADTLPLNRYLVGVTLPADVWATAVELDAAGLVGWDAVPVGKASLDWGSAWARSGASLLARVPSVIVPEEMNVLINPAHPEAAQVHAVKLRKWLYGTRLGC